MPVMFPCMILEMLQWHKASAFNQGSGTKGRVDALMFSIKEKQDFANG